MKLTPAQVSRFWREWSQTCKALDWTVAHGMAAAAIDAKRKEVLASCNFRSLTEVDKLDGFTRVLNSIIALRGESLQAGLEAENPRHNRGRVIRHQILTELVPCLELYLPDVRGYIAEIMSDKNRWFKTDRPSREMTLMDLSAEPLISTDHHTGRQLTGSSPLDQMRFTLTARLNSLRNAAGDTIHAMRTRAGVPCRCRDCAALTPR